MPEPKSISRDRQIIVEGRDAEVLISALLIDLALPDVIQLQNYGGLTELKDFLSALSKSPGFSGVAHLGVVRDAEGDPARAFESVQTALANNGLSVPPEPLSTVGTDPHVSVVILPDAVRPGKLEDICLESVADDPVIPCVEEYFRCIERVGPLPHNMSKAKAHAFLASRTQPDLLIGQAAYAGYWRFESPAFAPLRGFLETLARG